MRVGDLLYVSGTGPGSVDGKAVVGQLGRDYELADGTKKLFDELRTQLMTQARATSSDTKSTDDAQSLPPGPPPARGEHHRHDGGMFSRIASLLDQYRSTATDTTTETPTLSVA